MNQSGSCNLEEANLLTQPSPQSPMEESELANPEEPQPSLPTHLTPMDEIGEANPEPVQTRQLTHLSPINESGAPNPEPQPSLSTLQSPMDESGSPNLEEPQPSLPTHLSPINESGAPNPEEPQPSLPTHLSPEEMDESCLSNLEEISSPHSVDLTLHQECSDIDLDSKESTTITVDEDTTPCPVKLPLSLPNDSSDNSNLGTESENCTIASVSHHTTSCPIEEAIYESREVNDNDDMSVKSEECVVSLNTHTATHAVTDAATHAVTDAATHAATHTVTHAATPSPVVSQVIQDEGVASPVTPSSPSHFNRPLPDTHNPTNIAKPGHKVRKGVKRKNPSSNKGIQTSIHLLDSNSVFRDRIVDLDALRKETGVVCVEALQDLDVSLDEWPILLVSQLRLRDSIINSLNGVILEMVECGQVLEQDLDYLKLKVLELQQETKKRAKEDQQSHKTQGKETDSQTTEEDFTEAWSRWYYGSWGDYYSESDPSSSMYWPGHYTQQATVPSKDTRGEEIQQEPIKEEEAETTAEPHEEITSDNCSVKKKKKKSKEKESSRAKSEIKDSEKRKKLKAKRKEKHKSEKSCRKQISVEKEDQKVQDADKKTKKREKEESKRRKRKEEETNDNSQITESPLHTQETQEEVSVTPSTTEQNGMEGEEGETQGWDTTQSITQQVASVAAQAVVDTGYVFQEELGLYYDYNTGYYYNAENGLYYDTKSGTYFYYDHTTQSYQFHSQVSPTTTTTTTTTNKNNNNNKKKKCRKRKTAKKDGTKSCSKNEDSEDREEGECSESDDDGREENDADGENDREEEEEGDMTSPNLHEEEPPGDIPPSLRLMVVEAGERIRVGELHMVTLSGGTVGRESTSDVHLPDLNVSKMHAEFEYRSSGVEDHHYFLRDLGSNNGTFVNGVRLSEARQPSKQVEVGHGWEVKFGPIKVKCHLHPGNLTCNECEPGLVLQALPSDTLKTGEAMTSFKNAKSKEKARRKELKAMQKKYKLNHRDPQSSSVPAAGYTDRTLLRQTEKGSDNPYEKTEVASSETPLKKTNRGFALLQKMGWSQGQGLGKANTGRTEPVQPVSVVGQAGLGSCQSSALPTSKPNPHAERRRKQLQITQERYKQFSGDHQP